MEKNTNSQENILETNNYNCNCISDKGEAIYKQEITSAGGIDPKYHFEMYLAENTDLITLPGGSNLTPKINVTVITQKITCSLLHACDVPCGIMPKLSAHGNRVTDPAVSNSGLLFIFLRFDRFHSKCV